MANDIYGQPLESKGYDIVDSMIMPYWKPALRDLGKRVEHPFQNGYKLHVTVMPRDADRLARAVLQVLQQANLDHKVVYPLNAYEEMCQGEQAGKFITIYPGPVPKDRQKGHTVAENKAGTSGFLWYITTSSYFK